MPTSPPAHSRQVIGDFAPKLVQLAEDVLFAVVWARPQLSQRDRSLVTSAALVATGKVEQMTYLCPAEMPSGQARSPQARS
jgi:4-carboxymuconolactone decarboxylase